MVLNLGEIRLGTQFVEIDSLTEKCFRKGKKEGLDNRISGAQDAWSVGGLNAKGVIRGKNPKAGS